MNQSDSQHHKHNAEGNPCGEEREDGDGDTGRQRPQPVLEVLGQAGTRTRSAG